MNVAICGFGLMGQTHAHCYVRHPNTKLIAIADMDSSRLHMDFVDISSIRCYSDIDALLKDADVDVVSVCAPTPWHAPMVTRALAAGKYVLCEKPMAANLQDVESILSASRSAPGKLMVAQVIRFWDAYVQTRQIVNENRLGQVITARFYRNGPLPHWSEWYRSEASGGVVVDLVSHCINYAQWLFGSPHKVRAIGSPFYEQERGLECVHGILDMEHLQVHVHGGWYPVDSYPFQMGFEIVCDQGTIAFDSRLGNNVTLFRKDQPEEILESKGTDAYYAEIDYFLTCIEENRPVSRCPPEESAMTVQIALALNESRRKNGAEITISD
ncbi:MAG: Gfo/Idh/MocA family oxidoreductase [Pirellulaceae bacterium]|nr:Gfo/Idh/MocA family oxidoreductase [Pirellulaceae bacterium]